MSKFVKVKTQLRDLRLIKLALDDLEMQYTENALYRHRWSGASHRVPILVTADHMAFGLRVDEDQSYEAVGDDMELRRIRPVLDRVTQRYAYQMVLAETAKAGFELVEEMTGEDKVIRMTVRRWK